MARDTFTLGTLLLDDGCCSVLFVLLFASIMSYGIPTVNLVENVLAAPRCNTCMTGQRVAADMGSVLAFMHSRYMLCCLMVVLYDGFS